MSIVHAAPVGTQLRQWRTRRRLSQLALAAEAEVSTRHLSCVETGRALPSREMILRLARRLDVPPRERNRLLTAAGFAPMYAERALDAPALAAARQVVQLVLRGHEPFPALALDRHWNVLLVNRAVPLLLDGCAPALLQQQPLNALRLSLHPHGMAPRIVNLAQWRGHVLQRLAQQVAASGDAALRALADELAGYPAPDARNEAHPAPPGDIVVPLVVDTAALGRLSFISTTTVFGTPVDITLAELALETFFPADAATASALRRAASAWQLVEEADDAADAAGTQLDDIAALDRRLGAGAA